MSEGNGEDIKQEEPKPQPIFLNITIEAHTGKVNVEGCIRNEPLAFWLLDKAKDIIKVYNIQANQPAIQPAGGIMNFVKNRLR